MSFVINPFLRVHLLYHSRYILYQWLHSTFKDARTEIIQRPHSKCRTFTSPLVEKVIEEFNQRLVSPDLARLFENAFPNTLDTTVRWHTDGKDDKAGYAELKARYKKDGKWEGYQSFIVTGDINAEWLRDSTNQLLQYQPLAAKDEAIFNLILGAINTQAEYVIQSPYCNAFQPPPPSGLKPTSNGQADVVHPGNKSSSVVNGSI